MAWLCFIWWAMAAPFSVTTAQVVIMAEIAHKKNEKQKMCPVDPK